MPIGKLKALNVARMKTPGMYGDGGGPLAASYKRRREIMDPAVLGRRARSGDGQTHSRSETERARGKSRENEGRKSR